MQGICEIVGVVGRDKKRTVSCSSDSMYLHVAVCDGIHTADCYTLSWGHGIDDHAVTNIDGRVVVVCDKVTWHCIGWGNDGSYKFLTIGSTW